MTNKKTRVWIDTDPGHDDAMALLLLANDPRVDIVGVSTVAGNAGRAEATRNAKFILALAGRSDIAVFAGADKPLVRDPVRANVHGQSGLDGVSLPAVEAETVNQAQGALIRLLEENQELLTILTLGPLTNIGACFQDRPDLVSRVDRVVIMGGAIAVAGNKSRVAEFNIFCDPEAAKIVFDAPVAKILVPLDPCNDVVLTDGDIASLPDGPVGSMLKRALKPYVENIRTFEGMRGALMYDPIAAYVLLDPDAFETNTMDVRVETASKGLTYGMTVAERRTVAAREENMEVVTRVDGVTFVRAFLEAIRRMDECPGFPAGGLC